MKIFCIILFFVSLSGQSQTIDYLANGPRIGDVMNRVPLTPFDVGKEGSDVLWDFSNIEDIGESSLVEVFQSSDSVLCTQDISKTQKLYLSSDTLKLIGYENRFVKMNYSTPFILLTYPFEYTNRIENSYEGKGIYCQHLLMKQSGVQSVESDSKGRLITSDGDTLRDVIRLHSFCTGFVEMYSPNDSLQIDSAFRKLEITETYQWYARGFRYPIYESSSVSYYDKKLSCVSTIQTAYRYVILENASVKDEVNDSIRNTIKDKINKDDDIIRYYITNNGSELTIHYDLDADATISTLICNDQGILYGREKVSQSKGTDYQMSLDIQSLPKGRYVLYINVNGKVYNEKFNVARK